MTTTTENTPEALPEPLPTAETAQEQASEQRASPMPSSPGGMEQLAREAQQRAEECRAAVLEAETVGQRTAELRAAAEEAEEAAEKLADAAQAAEKAKPSHTRTVLNAAIWAGGLFFFSWCLSKLADTATEARENRERFPRGTEDADSEPTAQPPEAVA